MSNKPYYTFSNTGQVRVRYIKNDDRGYEKVFGIIRIQEGVAQYAEADRHRAVCSCKCSSDDRKGIHMSPAAGPCYRCLERKLRTTLRGLAVPTYSIPDIKGRNLGMDGGTSLTRSFTACFDAGMAAAINERVFGSRPSSLTASHKVKSSDSLRSSWKIEYKKYNSYKTLLNKPNTSESSLTS